MNWVRSKLPECEPGACYECDWLRETIAQQEAVLNLRENQLNRAGEADLAKPIDQLGPRTIEFEVPK